MRVTGRHDEVIDVSLNGQRDGVMFLMPDAAFNKGLVVLDAHGVDLLIKELECLQDVLRQQHPGRT